MTVQNRAFNALSDTVYYTHVNTARTIDLNFNNGTRTLRISNESGTAVAHIKTNNVSVAATTTTAMAVLPTQTHYFIIKAGQTQVSIISSGNQAGQGYHMTLGDGGV